MKKIMYSLLTLGFLVSCSSGVGGDESIEPNNSIEELIINKQWWFESSDNTYGLFFGNNDSLFHIDEFCNSSFDGIYTINSDSTIDIMTYENGVQIIESWEIYYVTDEELSITINNSNSTIINQIFNTNNIPDICSEDIYDYLTQNIFYSDINEFENESCFRKKMIFNDNGSGIVGDICDYNLWNDSLVNFNWSINGLDLEIISEKDNTVNVSIISVGDTLILEEGLELDITSNYYSQQYIHNRWSINTPEFEQKEWMNYNFKLVSRYIHYETQYGLETINDTLITINDESIYNFCEFNPFVINRLYNSNFYMSYLFCDDEWFDYNGGGGFGKIYTSIYFENNILYLRYTHSTPDGVSDVTNNYSIIY